MARQIERSGKALLDMFTDMLELARDRATATERHVEPCDPGVVMEEAAAPVRPDADRKQLALRFEDVWTGGPVGLDRRRVRQILTNLAANAVKFTDAGSVTLRCGPARGAGARLRFEVEDTGPGVPDTMRERVFEPFLQLDGGPNRANGGVGLGLAISRRLASEMGGALGADAAPGGGAAFWLELP
jgi:signal transduction histidine kinase